MFEITPQSDFWDVYELENRETSQDIIVGKLTETTNNILY